jgi:hypothetical protein
MVPEVAVDSFVDVYAEVFAGDLEVQTSESERVGAGTCWRMFDP